jgi:hypothetical protein
MTYAEMGGTGGRLSGEKISSSFDIQVAEKNDGNKSVYGWKYDEIEFASNSDDVANISATVKLFMPGALFMPGEHSKYTQELNYSRGKKGKIVVKRRVAISKMAISRSKA